MAGKSPRKSGVAGKQPSNLKRLKNRNLGGKSAPVLSGTGIHMRPRRFSLIYSSDSSLSALSDLENNKKLGFKNPKLTRKAKRGVSNEMGKTSKLIQGSAIDSDNSSSTYGTASENGVDDDDDDDNDDDDDDNDDDPDGYSSSSSSSDDDIDLVKLSAERKKKAMQAMTALKRGKSPKKSISTGTKGLKSKEEESNTESSDDDVMAFNFKNDDGIRFGHVSDEDLSDEDLGEEVADEQRANKTVALKTNTIDQLYVPQISESEESDYDIDRDAYFKTIESDNENITGFETGLETGEDDMPILDEEEQNIVLELENDDDLSFNGSIHEEGEDPVDTEGNTKHGNRSIDDYDEDEDGIMSDFDMPFYEDPKFANLYYCAGSDQPLSLSTSLPLILNDEKRKKLDKKQSKRREREELVKRRKQVKKLRKEKRDRAATPDLEGEEYLFSVFFHSDDEKENNQELESQLRQLGSAAPSDTDYSSDEEYENILLDIAHIPTDDESLDGMADEIDLDDDDDDDDDVSMSNVFIDIDDLDPDSFYFQYESSEDSGVENGKMHGNIDNKDKNGQADEKGDIETVIYVDDESTDEDETLPPPNSRGKKIGSKAKEVVSANVVGLKPPKLGTWETDNKPFSIIDGLSTKSLYPLIQEQQILEQQLQQQQQQLSASEVSVGGEKEELTLNELLNMSELEDEETPKVATNNNHVIGEWYDTPKVPLSAFRNKGIDVSQDEEYMLPVFSARKFPIGYVGSERTRRKIDRMKELQKKKNDERRKFKKKKKLLKLKRERERLEKERSLNGDVVVTKGADTPVSNALLSPSSQQGQETSESTGALVLPRKNSIKGLDLDDINNLLSRGDSDLIPHIESGIDLLENDDADILASLTAPVNIDTLDSKNMTTGAVWRRRQSIVEAAAENLRFTKSGLFSESALADLDQIIGTSNGSLVEFNDILQ